VADEHRPNESEDLSLAEALAEIERLKQEIADRDAFDDERAARFNEVRQEVQQIAADAVRREQMDLDVLKLRGAGASWRDLRVGRRATDNLWGLVLDEDALVRIATKVQTLASDYGGAVLINVTALDETEYRADSPAFFTDHEMPRAIKTVIIRYKHADAAVGCDLVLDAGERPHADWAIEGADGNRVTAFAHDPRQLLREYQRPGAWLSEALYPPRNEYLFGPRTLFLYAVAAFVPIGLLFWAVLTVLTLLAQRWPIFWNSPEGLGLRFLASLAPAVIVWLPGVPSPLKTFHALAPPVRFTGRLSDARTGAHGAIVGTSLIIIIPLLVGIVGNFLSKLLF